MPATIMVTTMVGGAFLGALTAGLTDKVMHRTPTPRWIRQIGIDIELNHRVTAPELQWLLQDFDAVFLGIGLGRR
jgi:hypothetical protein